MGRGREAFVEATRQFRRVAFDTSACIYHIARDPRRAGLVSELLRRAANDTMVVHLPGIVRLELLVRPFRSGEVDEMAAVERLIREQPGVKAYPMSEAVLVSAAQIRATTGLRTPDALVVASAAVDRCDAVIGNDRGFAAVNQAKNLEILTPGGRVRLPQYVHLDEYAEGE